MQGNVACPYKHGQHLSQHGQNTMHAPSMHIMDAMLYAMCAACNGFQTQECATQVHTIPTCPIVQWEYKHPIIWAHNSMRTTVCCCTPAKHNMMVLVYLAITCGSHGQFYLIRPFLGPPRSNWQLKLHKTIILYMRACVGCVPVCVLYIDASESCIANAMHTVKRKIQTYTHDDPHISLVDTSSPHQYLALSSRIAHHKTP